MLKQSAASFALTALLSLAGLAAAADTTSDGIRFLPSKDVQLRAPRSISVSADGVLYVADTGHHRIVAVDSAGSVVAETGGFGSGHGQFQWPSLVVADRGNSVWVLDYGNRRIEKFSRLLEYQGTLEILVTGDDSKHQPQALAVSPLGDLYVYDRDDGRLVRYDPLLKPQAELSSSRGAGAVSNITTMTFVPGRGLYWWSPESPSIHFADAWLNLGHNVPLPAKTDISCMASADSDLVFGANGGIVRWMNLSAVDTLFGAEAILSAGMNKIVAITISSRHDIFILDGVAGTVIRFRRSED